MARGFPSMTALLGLLAVAGFQNRDKIAEMLGGLGQGGGPGGPGQGGQGRLGPGSSGGEDGISGLGSPSGMGGMGGGMGGTGGGMGGLGGLLAGLGGAGAGGFLSGGLRDLVDQFTKNGQGEAAQSWVGRGPNKELAPPELEQAIGPDVLETLSQQTGLSRDELLARLSRELPRAIDQYTPEGRLPSEREF